MNGSVEESEVINYFREADLLCRAKNPLTWNPDAEKLMMDACRNVAIFQAQNSPEIAWIYKKHGFDPSTICMEEDLARIPPVGVTAMKHFLLTTLPHEK